MRRCCTLPSRLSSLSCTCSAKKGMPDMLPPFLLQYTALVDTHVPRLAACLGDANEVVRRQALALLANLLQKVSQDPGPGLPA